MQLPHPEQEVAEEKEYQKVAECLYRRVSSGVYYALVKRGIKQFRRSLKTTDRKIAGRKLSDFRNNVARLSTTASASRMMFTDLARRWLETQKPTLKDSSFTRRETSVQNLESVLGACSVQQVNAARCEEWASKRGDGLAASTYNNERDTMILILDYAVREGLLLTNPAKNLTRRKQPRHQVLIPSHEQFSKLVKALRSDPRSVKAACLVELLAYSGMRRGEAIELLWKDIDFDRARFVVTGGAGGTKNHEARSVPLFPALATFLDRLRAERKPKPDDPVVEIFSAKRSMEYACKKEEMPDFTHHTLRHYFVSNAVEAGVDFKTIAGWVGHKDGGLLVAKTYGHLRDTHSAEMAKRMTQAAPQ